MRIKKSYFNHFTLATLIIVLLSACGSEAPKEQEALVRTAKLLQVSKTASDVFLNYPAIIKSSKGVSTL